jgi:dTDP-4-dehydrorhamnose reductase
MKDAKEKATSIAESIGKKIGDIIIISDSDYVFDGLRKGWKSHDDIIIETAAYYGNFKTDIAVEKIKLSYKVSVTFQMK